METIKLLLVFCALAHVAVSDNKVVCYFTNWAWYRPDIGKYTPDNIDPDLCTHINYGFATLDPNELIMKPYDSWADIDNEFYAKVAAYSQYGIKVLISLGGWNDSAGTKYSTLVNNPSARANFVTNALAFVNQYGFGGIDLDWEYPVCPQNSCTGPASDKDGFTAWVQELAEAFHPEGLLVTAAVSGGHTIIDTSYDIPALSTYLDHINVMTYDYHGYFDGQTGHVSPLYVHSGDGDTLFNTDSSITQWIDKGADPLKVIMGFPLYGQSFTLCDAANNGLNAPSCGAGTAGTYTRQAGFLAYYEICFDLQQGGWTVVQDSEGAMGPYAYSGNQWVSYDDVAMVNTKAQYVLSRGLGGAMVWALDLDDFTNRCGTEAYPLLKTINRALRGYAK